MPLIKKPATQLVGELIDVEQELFLTQDEDRKK